MLLQYTACTKITDIIPCAAAAAAAVALASSYFFGTFFPLHGQAAVVFGQEPVILQRTRVQGSRQARAEER